MFDCIDSPEVVSHVMADWTYKATIGELTVRCHTQEVKGGNGGLSVQLVGMFISVILYYANQRKLSYWITALLIPLLDIGQLRALEE